jgi:hypothetical protein
MAMNKLSGKNIDVFEVGTISLNLYNLSLKLIHSLSSFFHGYAHTQLSLGKRGEPFPQQQILGGGQMV